MKEPLLALRENYARMLKDQIFKDINQIMDSTVTQSTLNSNIIIIAILQAMNGNFHPQLLHRNMMNTTISSIQNQGITADLPLRNNILTLAEIFHISEVDIFMYNTSLMYILNLPLIDYAQLTLMKLISLPTIHSSNGSNIFFPTFIPPLTMSP